MSAIALALAAWGSHYAYYLREDLVWRAWVQYIGTHAALTLTSLLLVPMAARLKRGALAAIGVGSCYLMAIESAQCVACGAMEFGSIVTRDLCVQAFGTTPYAAAAALFAATMLARWWRARHG